MQLTVDAGPAMWPERCLTDGRVVVLRQPAPEGPAPSWLQRRGREWRRLQRLEQWLVAATATTVLASPFGEVSVDAEAGALVGFAALGLTLLWRSREQPPAPAPRSVPTEAELACSGTPEARVAGAATRAWGETIREPSWRSPYLAASRAVFDGRAEVDAIVAVALRVHGARIGLGSRPDGPAGVSWDQQQAALDRAAAQLGTRADALIGYRDQAAALTAQLAALRDRERMERSAVLVDGLTVETALGCSGVGIATVTAEIEGVRAAMADVAELLGRRPLLELPPD